MGSIHVGYTDGMRYHDRYIELDEGMNKHNALLVNQLTIFRII